MVIINGIDPQLKSGQVKVSEGNRRRILKIIINGHLTEQVSVCRQINNDINSDFRCIIITLDTPTEP